MIRPSFWIACAALMLSASVSLAGELVSRRSVGEGKTEVAALDSAFSRAVSQVVTELAPEAAGRFPAEVKEILSRPRPFVASYSVHKRSAIGKGHTVEASVRVDRGKVRSLLSAKGIPLAADVAAQSSSIVAVVKTSVLGPGSSEPVVRGNLGEQDDVGQGVRAVFQELEAQGYKVLSPQGQEVTSVGVQPQGVPVTDLAASAMARSTGSKGTVVVGIEVQDEGPIRGTVLRGFVGRGIARVVDQAGQLIAHSASEAAGYGATGDAAADSTIAKATKLAVGGVREGMRQHWRPTTGARSERSLPVRIQNAQALGSIWAVVRRLASTRGVSALHLAGLHVGGAAFLAETNLTARDLVVAIRRSVLPKGASLEVRAAARGVEVVVNDQPDALLPE